MTNAVKSLYGSGTSHKKKRTAKSMIGDGGRPQQVFTPDWILDAVRVSFGVSAIPFDPCGPENPDDHIAQTTFSEMGPNRLLTDLGDLRLGEQVEVWPHLQTYINPPFSDLEMWMRAGAIQASFNVQVIMLVPVRTHREWFWTYANQADQIVFLGYNVKFKGHASAFPAPLCLLAFNCHIPSLGSRETNRTYPKSVYKLNSNFFQQLAADNPYEVEAETPHKL